MYQECPQFVLIMDLSSLSLSPTHSVGASDTVSSHGDYNSLLDESCEVLPEGGLGQVPATAIPPTTTTTHGNHCALCSLPRLILTIFSSTYPCNFCFYDFS